MEDRELLEFAARAASLEIVFRSQNTTNGYHKNRDFFILENTKMWTNPLEWNPLAIDGDAFRLAVKLDIEYGFGFNEFGSVERIIVYDGLHEFVDEDNDKYAATRRAIVRAAAEIGKAMK